MSQLLVSHRNNVGGVRTVRRPGVMTPPSARPVFMFPVQDGYIRHAHNNVVKGGF